MRPFASRRKLVIALNLAVVCFTSASSVGTTIDPMRWEQLVTSADFVGVVECTVAGGMVAKYRVVDAWKGEPADEVSIRVAVNYWEPQFPIALCGVRFLVTAYRSTPPSTIASTTTGGGVPLWWRQIPSDYCLPLFQGRINLSEENEQFFDSPYKDLASFKQAVLSLLQMPAEKQEEVLLRVLSDKYLDMARRLNGGKSQDEEGRDELLNGLKDRIAQETSPSAIVQVLLQAPKEIREGYVGQILRQAGGKITLGILEKLPAHDPPFRADDFEYTMWEIRRRLGDSGNSQPHQRPPEQEPSHEELQRLRNALAQGQEARDFGKALDLLTLHDPEFVAKYLTSWVNPRRTWRDAAEGYVLGSYFAWKCSSRRESHLRSLLSAKNGYIRVAAATYLCFENEHLGKRHLRKLARLDGDPGVWAALNLVRRGEKSAMPRALEVFSSMGESNMAGVPHRNLQKRLLVLLSNSCKASNITMPDILYGTRDRTGRWKGGSVSPQKAREDNLAWWDRTKGRLRIHDPWLPELTRQKID